MSVSQTASPIAPVSGAQAISRAVLVLRLIGRNGVEGARLTDLTEQSGLPHPTVRRILRCLIEERMVIQDGASRRYLLGPMAFELGLATPYRSHFQRLFRPYMDRLTKSTGDTVYLLVRSGADAVCLDRAEGSTPIRAVTLHVGGRRPLIFGAAGMAMLSHVPPVTMEWILKASERDIAGHGSLTVEVVRRAIERTRERGYGLQRDVSILGVSSIGIVIPMPGDRPMFGVSLAMVSERLPPAREAELRRLLKDTVQQALAEAGS